MKFIVFSAKTAGLKIVQSDDAGEENVFTGL